jgi:P-type Ca2+ transporter type 2C
MPLTGCSPVDAPLLRKAIGFIFAVHVPIAGLALLPLLFGLPILLGPMHIAFLEMVIDPVCSLVFEAEAEEDDVMRRPPRRPDEALFSGALIGWSILQGALAFILIAGIFLAASGRGMPEAEVRALTFFSLVLAIISLILVNRSFGGSVVSAFRRPNPTFAIVLVTVVIALGFTLIWPFAKNLFRFGPLHADDLVITVGAGMLVLLILEAVKPMWRKRYSHSTIGGRQGIRL